MQLTFDAVATAMDEYGQWKTALVIKHSLRREGYKFTDAEYSKMRRVILNGADGSPERTGDMPSSPCTTTPAGLLPQAVGTLSTPDENRQALAGTRFIFTCAQNNTLLHGAFWDNLQTFAKLNNADIYVGKISYNKGQWARRGGKTRDAAEEDDTMWYDPRIEPHVLTEQVKVAAGLVFCAELDTVPTSPLPFSRLENYTGPNSGIIPHTKMQMQSLATMKGEDAKFLYTTGAVTLRNYIDRRAGQVASYHHIYGALYVEVDARGEWFVRQINAGDDGSFYDLDTLVSTAGSKASELAPVIVLGDIHIEKADPQALGGAVSMCMELQPRQVILHDLIDFEPRNHHNIGNPHFEVHQLNNRDPKVQNVFSKAAGFLHTLQQALPNTKIAIIRSNHDEAFEKWLRDDRAIRDPTNMRFWCLSNAVYLDAIEKGQTIDIFEWAVKDAAIRAGICLNGVHFVQADESLVLDGIEYGMHGHLGANGARGNPKAYRQMGRKATTGHTHSAGIIDGIYTVGLLANMDMGYNRGLSSWSHSSSITYPNGKRTIITQRGPAWKA